MYQIICLILRALIRTTIIGYLFRSGMSNKTPLTFFGVHYSVSSDHATLRRLTYGQRRYTNYNKQPTSPNFAVGWLTLLLSIPEVPQSPQKSVGHYAYFTNKP